MKNKKFKRMFFDIETSPNVVLSWRSGYKINIDYNNIIKERAIICICWKWESESKIHFLTWDKSQNDKTMLKKFIIEMKKADEIIAQNGDKFDIKWLRTRALYHRLDCPPDFVSIDTLKLAKANFYFNSNRLDYISKFLGVGGKLPTTFDLWKHIVLNKDEKSMDKMIKYCKTDVKKLEQVFTIMKPYVKHKTHRAVFAGRNVADCPECTSKNTIISKRRVSSAGYKKIQLQCKDCGKYFTIPASKL